MILAKVVKDFYGAGETKCRIGEVLKIDVNDHLRRTGYLSEIEPDTPTVSCSCGRMFLLLVGSDDPEQMLNAHVEEAGKGHKPAKAKGKVPA